MTHSLKWREEEPDLDASGQVTKGGMWQHQRDWWHLPNFVRGLVTGYGGGKTFMLAKRMLEMAVVNMPVPVFTVSPTYPMASNTIVPAIDELLDGRCKGRPWLRYKLYKSQPFRFAISYGKQQATVWCYSGDDPDRLKGPNMGPAGIDEPFLMEKAVLDQVLARVRHPAAKRLEINITGTPEGVVGWGYDLFQGELRKQYDVGLVQASTRANLALPSNYADRLEAAYDEQSAQAYISGQFVNLSTGRVYHAFDPGHHFVDVAIPDGAEEAIGMDFNVDPFAFVRFWRKGDRLHVVSEHEMRNCDSEEAAAYIRRTWPHIRKVYPDASGRARQHAGGGGGKSAFAYMEESGLTVIARAANPLLVDRRNAVNGAFRHGRVTIGTACHKLRQFLLAYTHEDSNKANQKAMSHLLDAMGYPIAYLFPVDRHHTRFVRWSA